MSSYLHCYNVFVFVVQTRLQNFQVFLFRLVLIKYKNFKLMEIIHSFSSLFLHELCIFLSGKITFPND